MRKDMEGSTHFKINTGALIPAVGLGTWQGPPQETKGVVGEALKTAIKVGYRHYDCASAYGNQKEIGSTLHEIFESGTVKREEVWITSKLWCNEHDHVAEAFEQTLNDLQLDYLDLYLVHWPVRLKAQGGLKDFAPLQLQQTWQAMEKLLVSNRVRAIGVSNFSVKKIEELLSYAKVVPAVNQVECHPVWQQKKLHEYCASKGIHLSGYSPLGNWGPAVLGNPLVKEIGNKLGKTPAQVALRWGIQSGHSVLPKSSNADRLKENLGIFDWSIPEEDFKKLSEIEQERLQKGHIWVNDTTSPYKTVEELWDE